MSVLVSIGSSTATHFHIGAATNVKSAFGPHAFLVDKETNRLVDLDDNGVPVSGLRETGEGYALWSALVTDDKRTLKTSASSRGTGQDEKQDDNGEQEGGATILDSDLSVPSASSEEAKTISDAWKMAALEAKVAELTCWIEALTAANKARRQPAHDGQGGRRRGKKAQDTTTQEAASVQPEETSAGSRIAVNTDTVAIESRGSKQRSRGSDATVGYGFAGKEARPKDLASASVLETEATPVAMPSDVEGGGPEWEGQPVVGLRPIGYLQSCFLEKNGTPRQGVVARTSRGKVSLNFGSNPAHALSGLTEFSHVWVLWLFHDNGNKTLKAYIHPPRLNGERRGIFATRTPHRPNPIGLSLCRLDAVEGNTVHLSGVDIIQGTPILDIKPYIPYCDKEEEGDVRVPDWILSPPIPPLTVQFSPAAHAQLDTLMSTLRFFHTKDEALQAIADVLQGDPRSVHLRKKGDLTSSADKKFIFALDSVDVTAAFDETLVTVEEVVPVYSKLKAELQQAKQTQPVQAGAK